MRVGEWREVAGIEVVSVGVTATESSQKIRRFGSAASDRIRRERWRWRSALSVDNIYLSLALWDIADTDLGAGWHLHLVGAIN